MTDVTSKAGKQTAAKDLVLSAQVSANDAVFERLMRLHVADGATVADVTWGKGTFWKKIPKSRYVVLASDLKTGTDCRRLPYHDGSVDCVVLDPPYMEGFFRPNKGQLAHTQSDFRDRYSNGQVLETYGLKYHAAVLDLYKRAAVEAWRVLREGGTLIVKCQDEVSNHKQNLTHVEIINELAVQYYCKDLFVVVRRDTPHGKRIHKQQHARKNHSYFLVFKRLD